MKKQYKIQLPKGKKVTMTNVDFENGVMTVNVEIENESAFGRIATENLDKAAKERIKEHDKQIDKILKMDDDKDVRAMANMILQEYEENICGISKRYKDGCKELDEVSANLTKLLDEAQKELNKEQKYEPKDGDFVYVKAGYDHIAIFKKEVGEDMYVYSNWNMSFSISKIIIDDSRPLCCMHDLKEIRPATEREKKILIDQLEKVNKKWNPETKRIEDARWRAKEGGKYFYIEQEEKDLVVYKMEDNYGRSDDVCYNSGNYFKTREAAEQAAEQIRETFQNSKTE